MILMKATGQVAQVIATHLFIEDRAQKEKIDDHGYGGRKGNGLVLKRIQGERDDKDIGRDGQKTGDDGIFGIFERIKDRDRDLDRGIGKEAHGIDRPGPRQCGGYRCQGNGRARR